MEKIEMLSMGSTTIHPGFLIDGIPQLCEQGDSFGQTKRYNGVCSRNQPRVNNIKKIVGTDFDLTIAHTQIKAWIRQ